MPPSAHPVPATTTTASSWSFKGAILHVSIIALWLALEALVERPLAIVKITPRTGRGIKRLLELGCGNGLRDIGSSLLRLERSSRLLLAEVGKKLINERYCV